MLTEVKLPSSQANGSLNVIEIPFYEAGNGQTQCPTSRVSSTKLTAIDHPIEVSTVHALPLCSNAVQSLLPISMPPKSPVSRCVPGEAQFLPSFEESAAFLGRRIPRKRPASSVFDQAAERLSKNRPRGGESVAALASKFEGANILMPHKKSKSTKTTAASMTEEPGRAITCHKLTSVGTLDDSIETNITHCRARRFSTDVRTGSHKGDLFAPIKRSPLPRASSLSQVDSASSTVERNKSVISRVVIAGMRLYGLQQNPRSQNARTRNEALLSSPPGNLIDGPEDRTKDECKLVYHQAYGATICAFRNHMDKETLHRQGIASIQDTIDHLLAILCTDPLTTN